MSLLNDASIVITPNGYNVGRLYAVIPSSGAADMDVTRATAATRVDENGLVNYAEVLGGEEDIDGNFPLPNTNWTLSGFTISDNKLHCVSDGTYNNAIQSNVFVIGRTYKITFDITGWTLGDIRVRPSGQSPFQLANANGSYTFYYTATNHQIAIERNSACDMYLENLVVKEVTRDNVPRIDYTGGGCPHILAEPMRTNLIPYSEDFTDSSWNFDGSNVNITRTPNATTSPSGENNATKLIGNNTSKDPSNSYIGVSTSAAVPYTISIFAKKGEYDYLVSGLGGYGGGYYAVFNLSNGTVSTSPTASGTTASIEDYGNGWYRCLVNTTNTGGSEILFVSPSVDGTLTTNYTNTTNGIYVWGGQVENGSYATSYIPNFGTALGVTRNQDIFTRDGIGSLINSTEGVLFVEMAATSLSSNYDVITLSDGTVSNIVAIFYLANTKSININVKQLGASVFSGFASATTYPPLDFHKIAVKYKTGDFALWIDGTEVLTGSGAMTNLGLSNLQLADGNGTSNKFFGKVKQLQVYDTSLSDEQLLQLTGESGTDFYESYAEMASALTYTIQ